MSSPSAVTFPNTYRKEGNVFLREEIRRVKRFEFK